MPRLLAATTAKARRIDPTALGRQICGIAWFCESPMVVLNAEPCGGGIDGLSDSHDPTEGAVCRERVPSGEGHPLIHQLYSVGAPSVLHRHVQTRDG